MRKGEEKDPVGLLTRFTLLFAKSRTRGKGRCHVIPVSPDARSYGPNHLPVPRRERDWSRGSGKASASPCRYAVGSKVAGVCGVDCTSEMKLQTSNLGS
jgi:hypothetical protein